MTTPKTTPKTANGAARADLDARLNGYLRLTAPQGRETLRCGPLLATFDPASNNPFRNYAVPDDGAEPSSGEIAAFVAACRARSRRPRVEYAPAAAPGLRPRLEQAGFAVEMEPPIMICTRADLQPVPLADGVELARICAHADLRDAARVQHEAYAEHGLGDEDPDRLFAAVAAGTVVILARDASGEAVGAGCFTPPAGGVTEVAGIGVRLAHRRLGIAAALTAALTAEAFAAGVELAFLTPGGDSARHAYERAGFRAKGTMLMIGLA